MTFARSSREEWEYPPISIGLPLCINSAMEIIFARVRSVRTIADNIEGTGRIPDTLLFVSRTDSNEPNHALSREHRCSTTEEYLMARDSSLTGVERFLAADDIIVSKTDIAGRITYANPVFTQIAGYTEEELLSRAHNIVRHPHMPRCVFKFLWDTIQSGHEVFAYVLNRAKNGDHYWVFAHVTPTRDRNGHICGFHSSRRAPDRAAVDAIAPLYRTLLHEESKYRTPKEQWEASLKVFVKALAERGLSYEEFVFTLAGEVV